MTETGGLLVLHQFFDVLTSCYIFRFFVIGFRSRRQGTDGVKDMEYVLGSVE